MIKTNDGVKPTSQTYKDNYDAIFKSNKDKDKAKGDTPSKECDKTNTQRENN